MIKATDEIKNDFLIYAQEVNQNRAFPDARDGLRPSQRAALYTMYRKGFSSSKPHAREVSFPLSLQPTACNGTPIRSTSQRKSPWMICLWRFYRL